jgi:putative ABC transport system permease protein
MSLSRYFRRKQWDAERAGEMEAYLEIETADNIARGMTIAAARSAARRKLGNATLIREEIYHMNSIGFVETVWRDLRYASRLLRKAPGFTLAAIASLALGIGANTAIFSVVHAVLLRALPYPQPDQLMHVTGKNRSPYLTIPEYEFWKEHAAAFSSVAGLRGIENQTLVIGEKQETIGALIVTSGFFRTLGVSLALGRDFNSAETSPNGPQAIILSDGLWRRSFGADTQVVGRVVRLGEGRYTVAGVSSRGFWFPQSADAFVPLRPAGNLGDTGYNTEMIARLNPGVSLRQAQAEMATLTEDYRRTSADGKYSGLTVIPYRDWVVGDVQTNLLLLFGAAALLLLIACSNLASLLLARLATRQKEIAVRLALGGSRGRLLRQFFTENMLLGLAGGAAGLLGAHWLLSGLVALIPFKLPASGPIQLDLPVLAFTFTIALGMGLAFSLSPFFSSSRLDVHETLKASGRSTGTRGVGQRTRNILVVGEVALSVTLLVAAALTIQSLYRMHRERLGFEPQGLITFWTPPAPERRRNAAALWNFEAALAERLRAVPGVRNVAAINVVPLTGQSNFPAQREGHADQSIGGMEVRLITPGYFETMGIPVLRGRSFDSRDTGAALAVILVNEAVARAWWPDGNPLGDHVVPCRFQGKDLDNCKEVPREVVGVVGDTKTVELTAPPRPTIYIPAAQASWYDGGTSWVVRGNLSPTFTQQLLRAVAELDPHQRVNRVRTMDDILASTTADSRFDAWLFGAFAALALLLTAIGIYGLVSFTVARRTGEFGTRMALGASRGDVLRLVLKQGIMLTAIGLLFGLAGALALGRSLSSLLFGVGAADPVSFAAVSAVLLAVGVLASYIPARRATKTDPMVALRYE